MSVQPATVTQASPLQVQLDGSTNPVNAVALDGGTFTVGARVAVAAYGRQLLVLGTVA